MRTPFIPMLLAVVLTGCPKKEATVTAVGARVVDWKLAQSDRESIRIAPTSDVISQQKQLTSHPTNDSTVVLKVSAEFATVTFSEDGKDVTHSAPVSLTAEVVEGGGYTFGAVNCSGPHYQLAAPGETPREMLLQCSVRVKKADADVLINLTARGDGTLE